MIENFNQYLKIVTKIEKIKKQRLKVVVVCDLMYNPFIEVEKICQKSNQNGSVKIADMKL